MNPNEEEVVIQIYTVMEDIISFVNEIDPVQKVFFIFCYHKNCLVRLNCIGL